MNPRIHLPSPDMGGLCRAWWGGEFFQPIAARSEAPREDGAGRRGQLLPTVVPPASQQLLEEHTVDLPWGEKQ